MSKKTVYPKTCVNLDIRVKGSYFRNMNMKNIGTKSIDMSDIMVYLAMFSIKIDNILCFWVLIR